MTLGEERFAGGHARGDFSWREKTKKLAEGNLQEEFEEFLLDQVSMQKHHDPTMKFMAYISVPFWLLGLPKIFRCLWI